MRVSKQAAVWCGVGLLCGTFVGCSEAPPKPVPPSVTLGDPSASAESTKPSEPAKPEATKPEDAAKPEVTKPEPAKPEPTKPEASKEPSANREEVALGSPELTAGIPGDGPLTVEQIKAWLDQKENQATLEIVLPLGLSAGATQVQGIAQNPMTRAKIELGRQLYFDTRLSADNTVACASCHHPDEGFAKHTQFGVGIKGQTGGRNSPISYNRILSSLQFWDGRAGSLEAQAVGPIANPIEMGNTHDQAVETIKNIPGYAMQFQAIFGDDSVNIDNVGRAIATFERAIVTGPAPFDYYEAVRPFLVMKPDDLATLKDDDAEAYAKYEAGKAALEAHPMSESAVRGRELFFAEKVGCTACHQGANLADEKYHNLGIGFGEGVEKPDLGRFEITKKEEDKGAFKTPTIRNVAASGPYMHDGSLKTLEEVVEHYAKGGTPNPWLSNKIKKIGIGELNRLFGRQVMPVCVYQRICVRQQLIALIAIREHAKLFHAVGVA